MERNWKGRAIITDTAYLPYSHCAWLDGDADRFIEFGHSEDQAVERLIEQLENALALDVADGEACPECGSRNIEAYDFGSDQETGYSDSGTICLDCRETFQVAAKPVETVPALVGFGAPAKGPAVASIGNGLFVRTRRAS